MGSFQGVDGLRQGDDIHIIPAGYDGAPVAQCAYQPGSLAGQGQLVGGKAAVVLARAVQGGAAQGVDGLVPHRCTDAGIRQAVAFVRAAGDQAQLADIKQAVRLRCGGKQHQRAAALRHLAVQQPPAVYQHAGGGILRAAVIEGEHLAGVDHAQQAVFVHYGIGDRLTQRHLARVHLAHLKGVENGVGGRAEHVQRQPDHPWFIATQAHPELKSRPNRPHPLFRGFIEASLEYQKEHK